MSPQQAGRPRSVTGHYEIRGHPIAGLRTIIWCEPGQPDGELVTLNADRMPLLHAALGKALRGESRLRVQPAASRVVPLDPRRGVPSRLEINGPATAPSILRSGKILPEKVRVWVCGDVRVEVEVPGEPVHSSDVGL